MKDFPVFATSNGVASLILKEVPYKQVAYIRFLDSNEPKKLLKECVDFCVAVGAERIYATGSEILMQYQPYAHIVRMCCSKADMDESALLVFPVLEQTAERFREIYNEKMYDVPMASYMTRADMQNVLKEKTGYFVHKNGEPMGIGVFDGECLDAIASIVPGAGKDVLCALCGIAHMDEIYLSVAIENVKAVELYKRNGFVIQNETEIWYQVQ